MRTAGVRPEPGKGKFLHTPPLNQEVQPGIKQQQTKGSVGDISQLNLVVEVSLQQTDRADRPVLLVDKDSFFGGVLLELGLCEVKLRLNLRKS